MGRTYKDLAGQQFGDLTVIKFLRTDQNRKRVWLCRCKCGTEKEILTGSLMNGSCVSCGCRKHGPAATWCGYGEISGAYWNSVKYNAKDRNLEFSVSIEESWQKFIAQDRRCALSGVPLTFTRMYTINRKLQNASLDRIDSNKGYISGNVQWIHKNINQMKWNMPEQQFVIWCNLVSDRKGFLNEQINCRSLQN